jgi:hypothetical protein
MVLSARRRSFVYNLSGLGSNYPNSPRQGYNIGPASGGAETLSDLYREIWIPANEMVPEAGFSPAEAGTRQETTLQSAHYDYLAFDTATAEAAYASWIVSEDLDSTAGTLKVVALWETTVTTGNFGASIRFVGIGDGENIDAATASSTTQYDAAKGTARYLALTAATAVSPASLSAGDYLGIRVWRDVNSDNALADVNLIGVSIQYHALGASNAQWS